ncbi:MAG TPA: nucleoside triphosphate pyrophosphohydrolase [Candidatus Sulfotelmatobacter sp.]|nr:nucleoside triphosphate pyrophosphohydrolase [Candidatus Sulfotelmatobacter sp.]
MESKDQHIFPKPKTYSPMAHRKGDFLDMAHFVDVPQQFKQSFIKKAEEVSVAKNRKERVSLLKSIFLDLDTYTKTHGISKDEIANARKEKAKIFGIFDEGVIGVKGEERKLVRDKYPKLPPKDGENYVYEKASISEFLTMLDLKLKEESSELMIAVTRENRLEELSDTYEVLDSILKYRNIDMREITLSLQAKEITDRKKLQRK